MIPVHLRAQEETILSTDILRHIVTNSWINLKGIERAQHLNYRVIIQTKNDFQYVLTGYHRLVKTVLGRACGPCVHRNFAIILLLFCAQGLLER